MMKIENDPSGMLKLLNIASRVEALARQASEESQTYRIAGRLARDPHDVRALFEAIIDGAKSGHAVTTMLVRTPKGHALLQKAMCQVSMHMWEGLWNTAHPDRFGQAWEGQDSVLMSVWRIEIQALIRHCHQEAILGMTAVEYVKSLITIGESEEVAEDLASWLEEVRLEDPPVT
jgi:hypothetical protein